MKLINENKTRKIFEGNFGYAVISNSTLDSLYNVDINVYDTYLKTFNKVTLSKAYEIVSQYID